MRRAMTFGWVAVVMAGALAACAEAGLPGGDPSRGGHTTTPECTQLGEC